jgi:hypothetical protein
MKKSFGGREVMGLKVIDGTPTAIAKFIRENGKDCFCSHCGRRLGAGDHCVKHQHEDVKRV